VESLEFLKTYGKKKPKLKVKILTMNTGADVSPTKLYALEKRGGRHTYRALERIGEENGRKRKRVTGAAEVGKGILVGTKKREVDDLGEVERGVGSGVKRWKNDGTWSVVM
jgi:hypothetical protein